MTDLLLVGAITRDQIRLPNLRWTQPGGAPWHAGLALAASDPETRTRIRLLGQAGPWARAFALPALGAAALVWAGPDSVQDTYFINDYQPDRRRQALRTQARPLLADDLPDDLPAAIVASPLYPESIHPAVLTRLFDSRSFVGLDAQGLLRRRDARGRVHTQPIDVEPRLRGASAIKFSKREFAVVAPDLEPEAAARRLAAATGAEVLVTSGARGALLATPSGDLADGFERESGIETPSLDTTGAGDVFLAGYVLARSRGAAPVDALALGTKAAGDLVRDRVRDGRRRQRVAAMRRLHALAAWAQRRLRVEAGLPSESDDLFASDGPLSLMLAPHFPSSPLAALHEAGPALRGAALTGAYWALLSRGWPEDPGLAPGALLAAVQHERDACSRLRRALIA